MLKSARHGRSGRLYNSSGKADAAAMQAAQHIAQQFSVLAVPTRRRGTSRFSLYLLEHGELGGRRKRANSCARGRRASPLS